MSGTAAGRLSVRIAMLLLAIITMLAMVGCSKVAADPEPSEDSASQEQAEPSAGAEEPTYTSWNVYINGDDSYTEGPITYTIALNLTADNPTGDIAGTYTGTATASTTTSGEVNGQQLNASAIAESSQLQFSLSDVTAGGELATLTADSPAYTGTGTITMQASGSGTIGGAGGGFSNNSSQPLSVSVIGSEITLKVPISGHTYTFKGTISGK